MAPHLRADTICWDEHGLGSEGLNASDFHPPELHLPGKLIDDLRVRCGFDPDGFCVGLSSKASGLCLCFRLDLYTLSLCACGSNDTIRFCIRLCLKDGTQRNNYQNLRLGAYITGLCFHASNCECALFLLDLVAVFSVNVLKSTTSTCDWTRCMDVTHRCFDLSLQRPCGQLVHSGSDFTFSPAAL